MPASSEITPAEARALWTLSAGVVAIRPAPLPNLDAGEAQVRTLVSGISVGTEALVLAGKVPPSEFERMRAPFQSGDFPFPVKYGYAAVGVVEAGPDTLIGRRVFALHPHQDRFVLPVSALTPLPEDIPVERCVLTPNLETALNAVWDSHIGPGDKVAIIGAGVVGSLVAAIVSRMPAIDLTLVDIDPARGDRAATFGARFATPADLAGREADFDCVIHASGHGAGLALAVEIAGFEARIIELSWYGTTETTLALGGRFHSRRLSIVASQVGAVSPTRRARFDHARRMGTVVRLLSDDRLDTLLGAEVPFDDLPARFGEILAARSGLTPIIRYSH